LACRNGDHGTKQHGAPAKQTACSCQRRDDFGYGVDVQSLRPGYRSGGAETASGESYDPGGWTAAIQIDLREMFGGVRYGKDYRPSYALVANGDKRAIVKINDVGPLERGRIIAFNEQTMHYFDPSLGLGLIYPVEVKPLLGDDWSPGPIASNN
jgi:rare lipoprotein A